MKKLFVFVIALTVFFWSCSPPVAPGGDIIPDTDLGADVGDDLGDASTDEDPVAIQAAAQETLKNLPQLRVQLPASLRADNAASQNAQSRRAVSRAMGDTTELSLLTLPPLKSQAWFDLQKGGSEGQANFRRIINKTFDKVKAYASANSVPLATDFSIPFGDSDLTEVFGMPAEMNGIYTVTNTFRIVGDSTSDMKVYMKALMKSNGTGEIDEVGVDVRFDIAVNGTRTTMNMYFLINFQFAQNEDGTIAKSIQSREPDLVDGGFKIPMYAYYDSLDGSIVMAQKEGDDVYLQESRTDPESGALSTVSYSSYDNGGAYINVAYGDDEAGGIASMSRGQDSSYFWGEYYNGQGELLRRDNGNKDLWVPVGDESYYTNLKTLGLTSAPEELQSRSKNTWVYDYDNNKAETINITELKVGTIWKKASKDTTVYDYSTGYEPTKYYKYDPGNASADAEGWVLQPSSEGNYYSANYLYKESTSPGGWVAGDSVYYWKDWNSEYYQDTDGIEPDESGWVYTTTFYKGYQVPPTVNRFGQSFYMDYEYPLRQVLPLSPAYASQYKLIQREQESQTSTWYDWDGTEQSYTWTWYEYFLNKNERDINGDNVIDEDDAETTIIFDEGIDVRLDKLSNYDMYYWSNNELTKVKADFFRTTGDIPEYFSVPDATPVNKVNEKLQALIDSVYAKGMGDYTSQVEEALAGPTAGVF